MKIIQRYLQSWTKALGHTPFSTLNSKGNAPLPLPHPNSMFQFRKFQLRMPPKSTLNGGGEGVWFKHLFFIKSTLSEENYKNMQ